jgi:hypothetical protein
VGLALGCQQVAPEYRCASAAQCVNDGVQGTCESAGFCAFPDPGCPTGRRYGAHAGDLSGACVGTGPPFPVNDRPEGAIDISVGGEFTGELGEARDDALASCGAPGGRDLFYEFTLPAEEVIYVDTYGPRDTDFRSVLSIRDGGCEAPGDERACDRTLCTDGQSLIAAQLPAGRYCLLVDQADGGEVGGHLDLTFIRGGRTGTRLPSGPSGQTGDTCGAPDLSQSGCGAPDAPDHAFYFTACDATLNTTASTCNGTSFPSALAYRQASSLSPDVQCGDAADCPGNMVGYTDSGPGLFWLIVDGDTAGACGAYTLSVQVDISAGRRSARAR